MEFIEEYNLPAPWFPIIRTDHDRKVWTLIAEHQWEQLHKALDTWVKELK